MLDPLRHPRIPGIGVAFSLLLAACAGVDRAPVAYPVAPEIGGALDLPWTPVTLERLEARLGIDPAASSGVRPGGLVDEADPSGGGLLGGDEMGWRVARVAEALLPGELERIVREQAASAARLDEIPAAAFSGARAERFLAARNQSREAARLLEAGDAQGALRQALEAADALDRLRPERLADEFIGLAEGALRRNPGARPYTRETRERVDRLLEGARSALADGDARTALMRAYYACGLVGIDPG